MTNHQDRLNRRWIDCMKRGDFEAAWRISDELMTEQNPNNSEIPRHFQRVWDGTPVNGKRVLVRCYHGLGDTIQFIRYAPLLKSIAREVIVWVQPRLIPILKRTPGIDRLLPLHNGFPDVEYDIDVELNELPYVFRTTLDQVPSTVPYLHVQPLTTSNAGVICRGVPPWTPLVAEQCEVAEQYEDAEKGEVAEQYEKGAPTEGRPYKLRRRSRFSVGLVWKAGDWDDDRSIPFSELSQLGRLPEIDLHILQRDAFECGWQEGVGVLSGGHDALHDARVMKSLDLMISVDSMPAHLAGALGVPVWALLKADPDWRWMEHRSDSPWYPTMRLYRQRKPGEWAPVVDQVVSDLRTTLD